MSAKARLTGLFNAALGAATPEGRFTRLPEPPAFGQTIVLGAGKAAASMAAAFETAWHAKLGDHPIKGLVITRDDHGTRTHSIDVVEASHPVPDARGQAAARRILEMAQEATEDDLVVFLLSGGASALLSLPADGLSFADKQDINRALLRSGAPIGEMNRVRQGLSAVKGGRLAAAAMPARQITYLISDVPGDDPRVIGSGPTVPPLTGGSDPNEILWRYDIDVPPQVGAVLSANVPPALSDMDFEMIATPQMALEAAALVAEADGLTPMILGDAIEGEARDVARMHAAIATQVRRHRQPLPAPAVLLSGGETTVTVCGKGRGGRNVEFLLALAIALDGAEGISAIAGDTDGIDGIESNAGAFIGPDTLARAQALGLDPRACLDQNDAFTFFQKLGDLITTGPTLTNVNDFRAIEIL